MSKTSRRFCKPCNKEMLHDQRVEFINGHTSSIPERIFMGIVTMGLHEADKDKFWICQCCKLKTRQN